MSNDMIRKNVLSILMPVYNERVFLKRSVEKVMSVDLPRGLQKELVMVDDCSTDGTDKVIAELCSQYPEIKAYRQDFNQGKGAAIRRAVAEMSGEYAIIQDADLEYDPNEYPVVLKPLLEGHADVVYGSRFATREMRRVLFYHHKLGNLFLTHLSNFFTGFDLTDMETCYKAFRADVLKTIPLRSNRFGIEPEITAKIAKRGCQVYEVPISYYGRGYDEGKKIGVKDGFQAIYTILKYWMLDDCYNERFGRRHLQDYSQARRTSQRLAALIAPLVGDRIIEIGGGIGNLSRRLPRKEKLTVTETNAECRKILEHIFADDETAEVIDANPQDAASLEKIPAGDTVIMLNQMQLMENDVSVLENIKSILEPGGRLIVEVPAHPYLFSKADSSSGCLRRYSSSCLKSTLEKAGYEVEKVKGFNFPAMFFYTGFSKILGRKEIGKWQIKCADMLQFIFGPLEKILPLPGVSLIAVAKKK